MVRRDRKFVCHSGQTGTPQHQHSVVMHIQPLYLIHSCRGNSPVCHHLRHPRCIQCRDRRCCHQTHQSWYIHTHSAKDVVNCIAFSRDGKLFATGSYSMYSFRNDKTCVLWKFNIESEKKIEPYLKFTLSEAVLTMAFNPLTHELFVAGAGDFALYTPGKQDIPKEKYK